MDGFEFRHAMHMITKPNVQEVVQDLSKFLKNIDVYETRVYSFQGVPFNATNEMIEEANKAAFGYMDRGEYVDGYLAPILRDGLAAPDIKHYIIATG